MTTLYPTDLPDVPDDRWGSRVAGNGGDIDDGTAWLEIDIQAGTAVEAERRALAVIGHDYQDDLRGAVAESIRQGDGSHSVRISLARPR